ncbi:MAG TPA: hypothetical protein VMW75_27350 [Thermoanaerobaculia bacterium]|nr:hypothetical protein [Thermoanaerobaculia bacterium]
MPQPPPPHPAAAPPGSPGLDDNYAAGYRDGLANDAAHVSGAGEAPALFADLLEPGAVAAAEERYLRGYFQGQHDRQHPSPGAPGRPR